MTVYLHKYFDQGELMMELFFPHATAIETHDEYEILRMEVQPTRVEPSYGNSSNVYFQYNGQEHIVVVDNYRPWIKF